MGAFASLSRVELRHGAEAAPASGTAYRSVAVPLRVVAIEAPWRNVTAVWIPLAQLPLLRRLAYALPHSTIAQARSR